MCVHVSVSVLEKSNFILNFAWKNYLYIFLNEAENELIYELSFYVVDLEEVFPLSYEAAFTQKRNSQIKVKYKQMLLLPPVFHIPYEFERNRGFLNQNQD